MASKMRLASIVFFVLVSLFLIWFGWVYMNVKDMLWFHAAAVPDAVKPLVRPLYFALMTLIGGSSMGLGVLGMYVTMGPMRRGAQGAATAVAATFALAFVMAAITAEKLAAATGAPVSWHIMGVLLVVTALAYGAHLLSARSSRSAAGLAPLSQGD
ncbi:hypothetical protein [Terricaulis sp.]|uniref:hypothetical protein n=1 Tax=Terricaulis sp. TaxID=2768686 RepID=UPI003783FD5B